MSRPQEAFSHIAQVLKEGRLRAVLSQSDLAKIMGFKNGQFVSNIERGKCSLPAKNIVKLCQHLSLDYNHVVAAMTADYKFRVTQRVLKDLGSKETPKVEAPRCDHCCNRLTNCICY